MKHEQPGNATQHHSIQVAEYVCGLLKPNEHAEVHRLLSHDDQALTHALAWEADLLALVDALPPVRPEPALRERLQRTLGIGPPPALQPPPQPQLLRRPSRDPASSPLPTPEPVVTSAPENNTPAAPVQAASEEDAAATLTESSYADGHHQAAGLLNEQSADETVAQTPAPLEQHSAIAESDRPPSYTAPASMADESVLVHETPSVAPPPAPVQAAAQTRPATAAAPTEPTNDTDNTRQSLQRKLWLWRLIGVCASAAAIVGFMRPTEPPPAPVQIVKVAPTRAAILQAPGTTSTPGWTATLGPEGDLIMQPLVHTEVPAGSQVLLWTRSTRIPESRLLGRIDPNQPVLVPAEQLGALADDQLLEITLETDANAAQGVPNGPILFIGKMAVFGSEGAAVPSENNALLNAADAVTQ